MNSHLNRHWILIGMSWALSLAAAAWMMPQLYWNQTMDLVARHDPAAGYLSAFTMISQWMHGGVALFDRFDHLSFAFTHLSSGVYTLSNVFAAVCYVAVSPMLTHPGEQFIPIYIFAFQGFNLMLRTVGGYLILRRLRLDPGVIIATLVVLNTVLSLTLHLGLLTNNLYSYLPLLMYFFWVFVAEVDGRYLLWFLVLLSISVANSPLFALGYFYLVVHFFMLSNKADI